MSEFASLIDRSLYAVRTIRSDAVVAPNYKEMMASTREQLLGSMLDQLDECCFDCDHKQVTEFREDIHHLDAIEYRMMLKCPFQGGRCISAHVEDISTSHIVGHE